MNNWISIEEKWPDPLQNPLILVACPAFSADGSLEKVAKCMMLVIQNPKNICNTK